MLTAKRRSWACDDQRQRYIAITARAQARLKGEAIDVEATTIEPGEPTGGELLLDESLRSLPACVVLRGTLRNGAGLLGLLYGLGCQERDRIRGGERRGC